MALNLATAADWLTDTVQDSSGVSVTYRRGVDTVTLTAIQGMSGTSAVDEQGARVVERSLDIIVKVDELILDSVTVEPRNGDRVVIGSKEYEVRPIGGDGQPHRYTNQYETDWRIHLAYMGDA